MAETNSCIAVWRWSRQIFVPNLMHEVSVRFGDNGVTTVVPESIGQLPFDASIPQYLALRVQIGDSWKYERLLIQSMP